MQNMYWLITIVRRDDAEELNQLYQKLGVVRLYGSMAWGTARSQVLSMLGLEKSEKVVAHSVVDHNKLQDVITALEQEFKIDLPDRGIAVAVPLSSVATRKTLDFYAAGHAEDEMIPTEQKEGEKMELIVAICNKGYTEDVMEAARKVGGGGGTIIHAKGTASEYAEQFFGISLMHDKEIIYMVCRKDKRSEIMQIVSEEAGIGTKAHTLLFSLPVTDTAGFRLYTE